MTEIMLQMQKTVVLPNSLVLWGLGQMGVALKGPEGVLYIDACLSDVVESQAGSRWARAYPPPLLPEQVSNADFFLISHEHLDHLDPVTIAGVAKASPRAKFVTSAWCLSLLADLDIAAERVIVPSALEPISLPGSTLRLTAVPSAHYEKEYDPTKGYRWLGYLIEWNGVTFYHAGDTIIYPDYIETLQNLPPIDIGMLPVNGRDYYRENILGAIGNLLPAEAAQLASDLGWDMLIPGHNDLFASNAIPNAQIIDALERLAPRQKYKMLQPGELCYYVK